MEPISTALTGLALARSGIAFIKENLNSVQDAAQIGQQLSSIFQGFDEFNKERYSNKIGFKDVADEMIQYRILQEQLQDLKLEINLRFGHGFYESIVAERKKRIEEREEKLKRERIRKRKELQEVQDIFLKVFVGSGLIVTAIIMLMVASNV
jgi:hypothetical protein